MLHLSQELQAVPLRQIQWRVWKVYKEKIFGPPRDLWEWGVRKSSITLIFLARTTMSTMCDGVRQKGGTVESPPLNRITPPARFVLSPTELQNAKNTSPMVALN